MNKTDYFNNEMLEYFSAEAGAYTFFTVTEINKGTYNVKTVIRDLLINYIGNDNMPVATVTDNQDIIFALYDDEKGMVTSEMSIPCKYSKAKAGKKEVTIYFPQKLMAKYHVTVDDVWFVFLSSMYTHPVLGMMQRRKWILKFSEDREFYSKQHILNINIDAVHLQNYRCFNDVEVNLNEDYTVLVGINGTGKTSILDGIAVGISGFLDELNGSASKKITKDDARISTYYSGKRLQTVSNYPVGVEINASVDGQSLVWRRVISTENSKLSPNKDELIETLAYIMREEIKDGNNSIYLPIVAYYGTDRLRNIYGTKNSIKDGVVTNRLKGYDYCLASAIDYKKFSDWFEEMTLIELQDGEHVPELNVVKTAVQESYNLLTGNEEECRIDYQLKSKEIEISRIINNKTEIVPLRMLSDGMKSVLIMIGDIAYRMAKLNPDLSEDITKLTPGIVIIDEIDMHLHPSWQKNIIKAIKSVFPRIQLITTTHAPSVLTNISQEHLVRLYDYNAYDYQNELYGRDIDSILSEVMDTTVRPNEVIKLITEFDNTLDSDIDKAEGILDKMERILGPTAKEVVEGRVALDVERAITGDDID